MKKSKPTAGERMIESARQALAFAKGRENHGYEHTSQTTSMSRRSEREFPFLKGSLPSYSV
jgi:hypothetical protein